MDSQCSLCADCGLFIYRVALIFSNKMGLEESSLGGAVPIETLELTRDNVSDPDKYVLKNRTQRVRLTNLLTPTNEVREKLTGDISRIRVRFYVMEEILSEHVPKDISTIIISYWSPRIKLEVCDDIIFEVLYPMIWSGRIPFLHTYFHAWHVVLSETSDVVIEYENYHIDGEIPVVLVAGDHIATGGFLYPR